MHYCFITGSSRGIGKALAERLLQDEATYVTGMARSNHLQHPRYTHHTIDLSDLEAVKQFHFPALPNAKSIVLVNNSGTLGNVAQCGHIDDEGIIAAYHINLVAPAILTNHFVQAYQAQPAEKLVMNISSGAGKRPIDGWMAYCSTKAGLDLLSEVVAKEQHMAAHAHPIRVLSIAPGIVDTQMQDEIRAASKDNFSRVEEFIAFKSEGHLADPANVASKLYQTIKDPALFNDVIADVRHLN